MTSITILSKTATSILISYPPINEASLYRIAYSIPGFVYYTWTYIDTPSCSFSITGLEPSTPYVFKVALLKKKTELHASDTIEYENIESHENLINIEYGPISEIFKTFSQDESEKRNATYYEHALILEKKASEEMNQQVLKLKALLDPRTLLSASTIVRDQDALLKDRSVTDGKLQTLQNTVEEQTGKLCALQSQKRNHEELIESLLKEAETLRAAGTESAALAKEAQIMSYQSTAEQERSTIASYEKVLEETRNEIRDKEIEVERIMEDCRRVVQEHADTAQALKMTMEDALEEAKESLERQVEMNALLRQEMNKIGPAYTKALETIERLTRAVRESEQ